MTDRKLVFMIAVASGSVVRTIGLNRGYSLVEQVIRYAMDCDIDKLLDKEPVGGRKLDDFVSEYLDYQFEANGAKEPQWLKE